MASQLISLTQSYFDLLQALANELAAGGDISALRQEIVAKLQGLDRSLAQLPDGQAKAPTITYLLASLADEMVLASAHPEADNWQNNLLEMEFFNSSVAGERFFDLLEQEGYRDPELAEIFYYCLALGFQGKFRRHPEKIRDYKERLYVLIPSRMPSDENRLSPGAEFVLATGKEKMPPLFGLWTAGVMVVVSLTVYVVASQWLWSDASAFIHRLSNALPK